MKSLRPYLAISILALILTSCLSEYAKEPKKERVYLFTNELSHEDSILIANFEKESKVKVFIQYGNENELRACLKEKGRYNLGVDLILLNGIDRIQYFREKELLLDMNVSDLEHISRNRDLIRDRLYESNKDLLMVLIDTSLHFRKNLDSLGAYINRNNHLELAVTKKVSTNMDIVQGLHFPKNTYQRLQNTAPTELNAVGQRIMLEDSTFQYSAKAAIFLCTSSELNRVMEEGQSSYKNYLVRTVNNKDSRPISKQVAIYRYTQNVLPAERFINYILKNKESK